MAYIFYFPAYYLAQKDRTVEYTDCISAEGRDFLNVCPDMTLNNFMVRL